MKISVELMSKANIIPRLKLGEKDGKGVVRGTGPHRVKIIEDSLKNGKDPQTGEVRPIVRYIFEENGKKFKYEVPVKDKTGELHYLVQRLSEFDEGEELIIEMKRKGIKNYVHVISVKEADQGEVEEEEMPAIEYPEEGQEEGANNA